MNRRVAAVVVGTLLALVAAAVGAGTVWWLAGSDFASKWVFCAILVWAIPAEVRETVQTVAGRPLPEAWGLGVLITIVGLAGLGFSWMVPPIWDNPVSWLPRPLVDWSQVCWPMLIAEQALILLLSGGLLTWVVRRERRRRAMETAAA